TGEELARRALALDYETFAPLGLALRAVSRAFGTRHLPRLTFRGRSALDFRARDLRDQLRDHLAHFRHERTRLVLAPRHARPPRPSKRRPGRSPSKAEAPSPLRHPLRSPSSRRRPSAQSPSTLRWPHVEPRAWAARLRASPV